VVVAGHVGDHHTVVAALADPSAELRAFALGAAHRLGLLDEGRLVTALADGEARVRRRAAQLAGRCEPTAGVVARLVSALGDEAEVAEEAAFALGELGVGDDTVVSGLTGVASGHPDALCREAAVASLGALGAGLPAILHALANDRATVRRRAVIALAAFDGPEVVAALRRALGDRDWQVRQAAEDLSGG
jgi:HEAT repeat protein